VAAHTELRPPSFRNEAMHRFITGGLLLAFRTVFRMKMADVKPLPEGPVILAANHRSYLDPAVLGSVPHRRVAFVMAKKYYEAKGLSWFYRMERCIPVADDADNRTVLRASKSVLDERGALGIFPEGHISPDGTLQPFQAGVAWLAAKTGAQVVPAYIGGTRESLTKGSWRLRFHRVTIRMGEPLRFEGYAPGRAGQDAFLADLRAAIEALAEPAPR